MSKRSSYYDVIARQLKKLGRTDIDPRHIEAYMKIQYRTLDHFSDDDFFNETKICMVCVLIEGNEKAELLAQSMGI